MIVTNLSRSTTCRQLTYLINLQFSNTYPILDIKNSHLLFVDDPSASLPFMSEVTLESGEKGVVLKIGERNVTAIGMYHKINASTEVKVQKFEKVKDFCANMALESNYSYNIEGKQTTTKI